MRIEVSSSGKLLWRDKEYHCALGRSGVKTDKREGDGTTPVGCFPIRHVLYRVDKIPKPVSVFKTLPLQKEDAWCDDPADEKYNQFVKLPYAASHENLWREDDLYDVIVVLGYNDDPPQPGKGSAIFLHVARQDYSPTEGCVALALPDLLEILKTAQESTKICISE